MALERIPDDEVEGMVHSMFAAVEAGELGTYVGDQLRVTLDKMTMKTAGLLAPTIPHISNLAERCCPVALGPGKGSPLEVSYGVALPPGGFSFSRRTKDKRLFLDLIVSE